MKIERSVQGVVGFCLDKVEEIDESTIATKDKAKLAQVYLREARGFLFEQTRHAQLISRAPGIGEDPRYQLQIGGPQAEEAAKPRRKTAKK